MEIGKARKVRGGHKGYVNKVISQANEICHSYDGSAKQREQLAGLKSSLDEKLQTLQRLDEQILEIIKEDEIEKEILESGEFLFTIYSCLARIEMCLGGSQPTTSENGATSTQIHNANESAKLKPKLPKLTLKEFSGDPTHWQTFWDTFETAIYKNDQLSDVDKFNYLKGCLRDSAARAIDGIPLSNDGFKLAIDILKDRFANPQLLISTYMDSLLKLPAVIEIEQISKLRDLYDKLEINIRSLEKLDIKSETYGNLLSPIIMSKIPSELRLIISRKFDKEHSFYIQELMKVIKAELEARERCAALKVNNQVYQNTRTNMPKSQHHLKSTPATASALLVERNRDVYCSFCSGNHCSVKCNVYSDSPSRRPIARQKGRCYVCLRKGHVARNCRSTRVCQKCAGKHHTALCEKEKADSEESQIKEQAKQQPDRNTNSTAKSNEKSTSNNICNTTQNTPILLQTAVAPVGRPDKPNLKVNARIIFDSGSQRSYITNNLSQQLNLKPICTENLIIKTFGEETKLTTCELVQLSVTSIEGMELYVDAYSVPSICKPLSNQIVNVAVDKYPVLKEMELADIPENPESVEIDVLLGADYYWNFVTNNIRKIDLPGPTAIYTKLGWLLSGPVAHDSQGNPESSVQLNSTHILKIEVDTAEIEKGELNDVKQELKRFWELESLGILDDELSVYDKFNQAIHFDGERYQAELPFKEGHPILPDNYDTCLVRLKNLLARLRAKPEVMKEYNEIIQEQLEKGIIEPVPDEEERSPDCGTVHYLPHREVIRTDKETIKLRIVYDASARGNGASLNDCLLSGPPLSPLIFDILLRFRLHKVAMVADIEKASLNISVKPEHRDYLRFLWVDDPFSESPAIQEMRFKRVVFGVTSSPFILNATIRHHMNQYSDTDQELVDEVLRSLYVDDYASGSTDSEAAFRLSNKIKTAMAEGGFNTRKWTTNSEDLMNKWSDSEEFTEVNSSPVTQPSVLEEEEAYTEHQLPKSSESSPRVLGQLWDTDQDEFKYNFVKPLIGIDVEKVTKRMVLSATAKFFDPLGLISPTVLMFKLMFQDLCKNDSGWDDELEESLQDEWKSLTDDLREVENISLARCYCQHLFDSDVKSIELHVFGDASETSYGSCIYIRCEHETEIHCSLVAAKTRVAPMKNCTIPRLELLACLISVKLAHSVQLSLNGVLVIDDVIYWTDSTVALSWIQGVTKEFKQFVQNRVTEIRRLSSSDSWKYCPTDKNPADIASRGAKASDLVKEDKWWNGPTFLVQSRDQWPQTPNHKATNQEYEQELKSTNVSTALNAVESEKPRVQLSKLISISKYSSVLRLIRVTAYVLRFVNNIKCRMEHQETLSSELSDVEINFAEKLWIKEVQEEIEHKSTFSQMKESLNLKRDQHGILRCHGRLDNAPLPHDTIFPMLLPSKHEFTDLMIRLCHKAVMHNGVQETLAQLRSRFWVVKGRQSVKRVLSQCRVCRKLEGKSYVTVESPPLPEFRLNDDFAFTNIGVDYAGPLFVKDIYSDSNHMNKAYIALYTCASSRAVHLDLVPDASSNAFIRSLQRFICRRGIPSKVLSDNSKTFKSREVKNFTSSQGISWKFNVARSPWWGGFFERLVRSMKRCLKKTLGNAKLTYEELLTLVVQVESVLNSRPLTYLNEDGGEPLTPSHLVLGKRLLSKPSNVGLSHSESAQDALKRDKYLQTVLTHFWNRWKIDYLTQLREHHRPRQSYGLTIHEGDIVCIKEDKKPRQNWKLGRVHRLLTGKDKKVRAAKVKVHNNKGKAVEISRPVQKLYPIELQSDQHSGPSRKESKENYVPITFVKHALQENIS